MFGNGNIPHHSSGSFYSSSVLSSTSSSGVGGWNCRYSNCSYVADRESALIKHMRTHTGEKPFGCCYCSYKSSQSSNLKSHIRKVHGVNPVQNKVNYNKIV